MNRMPLYGAAVLAALVPAAVGLWGNGSFSQAVPVNVPASAQIASLDDHPESRPTRSPFPSPKAKAAGIADDHGGATPRDQRNEAGDDHGDTTARNQRTETGDDRGDTMPGSGHRGARGSRSSGSSGGHDDGSGHHVGDHHGGSGSGGHGSDD